MESANGLYTHKFSPWRVAKDGARIVASERTWKLPLRWDREAKATSSRPRVWVGPDVFEDWAGELVWDEHGSVLFTNYATWWEPGPTVGKYPIEMYRVRDRLFDVIDQTPHLNYLLCTEKPENVLKMTCDHWATGKPGGATLGRLPLWPKHVWLGTTAASQAEADERIPHLLRVPAVVWFVRITGQVDLSQVPVGMFGPLRPHGGASPETPRLNWIIVSGGSEPLHPDWVCSIRDQCQAAGVPFFFEGWGPWKPFDDQDPTQRPPAGTPVMHYDPVGENGQHWYDGWASSSYGFQHVAHVGPEAAGRMLDGHTWDEIPAAS